MFVEVRVLFRQSLAMNEDLPRISLFETSLSVQPNRPLKVSITFCSYPEENLFLGFDILLQIVGDSFILFHCCNRRAINCWPNYTHNPFR